MTDWGTAAITANLDNAARGYGVADKALAEGSEYAGRARMRMLHGNLQGIAATIGTIKKAIDQDRTQVAAITDRLSPLTAVVGTITDSSTPTDVIAAVSPVSTGIDALDATTLAAERSLTETETLIRTTLHGGRPEHLLAFVGRAKSTLAAVRTRLTKAKESTTETLRLAHTAGTTHGSDRVPAELGRVAESRAERGEPLPDPADRDGGKLMERRSSRASRRKRAMDMAVEKADELSEKAGQVTDFVKTGFDLRNPDLKPPSATHTGTTTPVNQPQVQGTTPGLTPTDVVSNLVVAAIVTIKAGERMAGFIANKMRDRKG